MFSRGASSSEKVPRMISQLEAKRDHQEQKSADMLARAKAALAEGRRDAAKGCLAQKATHDGAAAQYSALISTLTQQQAIADLADAHREIAGVIKTMKAAGDMSSALDRAADTAEEVAAVQSEMGAMGAGLFTAGDDLDAMLDALTVEQTKEETETPSVAENANPIADLVGLDLPAIPSEKPESKPPPSLGPAFAELMMSDSKE